MLPDRTVRWLEGELMTPRWIVLFCIACSMLVGGVFGYVAHILVVAGR